VIGVICAICAIGAGAPGLAAADAKARVSLTVVQITRGGTGTFSYLVAPYNDDPTLVEARSRRAGGPVKAGPERNLALLATTTYYLQVLPPTVRGGHWQVVRAVCNGRRLKIRHIVSAEVTFRIVFASNSVCVFTSRFRRNRPAG